MRVLHIDLGREMRGGQYQVLALLNAARHDAALFCRRDSPLYLEARSKGIRLAANLRQDADVIHAHDAHAHTRAVLSRKPLVVSRRVAFPVRKGLLSQLKYKRARHYITISKFVAQRLLEAGIDQTRISVVYDGVPDLPLSTRTGPIIAPASDDPMKGSGLVREAARLADVEIRFSDNLVRDLASASLLVYLSREEGLGSAALLAMSAGVPVIASRVGGLPEAVEDGVTGVVVDNNARAVADAMHDLLNTSTTAMATAARARWKERFTIGRMVEQTEAVYEKVIR